VLFGHAHQAYDGTHNGIRIYGTPSTCRQFRPGSSSFAVDDRPPAYRRLELAADGTFSTELVWLDAATLDG
jgi:Icc protein